MNLRSVIVVHGTKKSQKAGGLDSGEVSSFIIEPGEYVSSVNSPSDLVDMIDRNAYFRGEWIASLQIGGIDVIQKIMKEVLDESHRDYSKAVISLLEMGLFAHADGDELRVMLEKIAED